MPEHATTIAFRYEPTDQTVPSAIRSIGRVEHPNPRRRSRTQSAWLSQPQKHPCNRYTHADGSAVLDALLPATPHRGEGLFDAETLYTANSYVTQIRS